MIMRDEDVMLHALNKERKQLHDRIMQIDRVIKKIRNGEYSAPTEVISIDTPALPNSTEQTPIFPKNAELKVQIFLLSSWLST